MERGISVSLGPRETWEECTIRPDGGYYIVLSRRVGTEQFSVSGEVPRGTADWFNEIASTWTTKGVAVNGKVSRPSDSDFLQQVARFFNNQGVLAKWEELLVPVNEGVSKP